MDSFRGGKVGLSILDFGLSQTDFHWIKQNNSFETFLGNGKESPEF